MAETPQPWKFGRILALVFMGLTIFFTLTGGIGTTCVALGAEKYESMVGLVPYKPLYQALVVISIAAGIWGIPIMVALVRGAQNAYRNALIMLIVGAVASGIQTAVSQSVRGSSAPANVRFAITAFTLVAYLLFLLPPIWLKMAFDQPLKSNSARTASGAAFAVCGLLTLSAPLWVAQTHKAPWISRVRTPLALIGLGIALCGAVLLAHEQPARHTRQVSSPSRSAAGQ